MGNTNFPQFIVLLTTLTHLCLRRKPVLAVEVRGLSLLEKLTYMKNIAIAVESFLADTRLKILRDCLVENSMVVATASTVFL